MSELALARVDRTRSSVRENALFVATLLSATALAPLAITVADALGVGIPQARWIPGALLSAAAGAFLAWLYELFDSLRGATQTTPGTAIAAWLVPLGNLWLPALALREAWRATVGRGSGIVYAWMVAWWVALISMSANALGLRLVATAQGNAEAWLLDSHIVSLPWSAASANAGFQVVILAANLAAAGLLAHIVQTIGAARPRVGR